MFVSVIVPCYNHAPYLKERIESIIHQTYQNFELILLDDLSPDNSAQILLSYKDHPKISHCIINEKNSGSTFYQWNKGIELAKGELVWIAESDDIADLSFLDKLVKPFLENSNLVLAYSQSYRMDSKGNITGSWKDHTDDLDSKRFEENFTMSGLDYISQFIMVKNTIPNASAVLFKKCTYQKVGQATPHRKLVGDWEIWSKIITAGDIFYSSDCLNYFRYHETSVIAKAKKNSSHLTLRNDVIAFRQDIGSYWLKVSKTNPRSYSLFKENKVHLYKAISRNASLSIRKRYYKEIIPSTLQTLKSCPIYLIPILIIKLNIKLIYSLLIDAPIQKLLNLKKQFRLNLK